MIGCDFCEEWFHPDCLSMSTEEANLLTEMTWKCPVCEGKIKIDYEKEKESEEIINSFSDNHSSVSHKQETIHNKEVSLERSKRTKINVGPGEWLWLDGDQLIAPTKKELEEER